MSSLEIRVCGRFRIEQKLYEGKRSSIYMGKNVQSGTDCAIKCELKSQNYSLVLNEGRILENIQGGVGIPNLLWYGENGDYNFLVSQLLGNSLQDYFDICERMFSLKTVLMVADKILSSIEFIHYKNYLHRDVKPQNFLMGLGRKLHQIYTIDLQFSTTYLNPTTKIHKPYLKTQNQFVGTLRFGSLNVLRGDRNSRRDDLESIGLMMIYFLKGRLPWSDVEGNTLKQKRQAIRKIMQETSVDELCDGVPIEIKQYMEYCRVLKYQQNPDYNYLKRLLKERFVKEGYQYDNVYDWILIPLRLKDVEISNRIPLNRFTKKQDPSLSMCNNLDYDFKADICVEQKVVEVKKKPQVRVSQLKQQPQTSTKTDKKTKKNQKEDCVIY